jgi:ATP-dependent exoDNAse (exonuclease V) beta subunit
MIIDAAQRQQALIPSESFIVQAPAGSGKTELLTQRFLNLLTTVEQNPEEVLAITFTRKAANEMRQRIVAALHLGTQAEPSEPHKQTTWHIACKVLQRDQQSNWGLLNNPNRLRIQTIDALCSYLSKQLPVLSQLGSHFSICEDANEFYQQAASNTLDDLEKDVPWRDALAQILLHLDNNLTAVTQLLTSMLAHRDQWLPHIIASKHQPERLREALENNLQQLVDASIEQVSQAFPAELSEQMEQLLAYSLQADVPDETVTYWQAVANFCLTQKHEWRKTLNKNNGFPTDADNSAEKKRLKQLKAQAVSLLQDLQEHEGLEQQLGECLRLPPAHYTESQWAILQHLLTLLPVLAAQLNVIFQQHGEVDFVEVTQRALQALENDNAPTDLALCLDYQLKHILVDEFQDTSATQFRLIELLTQDWQTGDGRTLFVVGDPMQSIYRFRAAEVGLFLQAKAQGIGDVHLTPLTLRSNFRSIQTIVEWCNTTFSQAFPAVADISLGAIPYSDAEAVNATSNPALYYHHTDKETANTEAQTIVSIINEQPNTQTAILVKSRRHLLTLIPALKQANIPFQAIDIEPLAHLPFIQDLTVLTKALLHFADRLSWLALLRAPWCGLSLADLHTLSYAQPTTPVWQLINDVTLCEQLTTEGQQRLEKFRLVLSAQLELRGYFSLSQWLKNTWLSLGGPNTLRAEDNPDDAQAFFNLLDKLDQGGQLNDITLLEQQLEKLFAEPKAGKSAVQIMTIHKSKGLEFDRVIIPSLQSFSQQDKHKLLLWHEHPSAEGLTLLLAPIKARAESHDAIYDYLRHYQQRKSLYENTRLFYVATTRAKQSLHLLAEFDPKKPARNGSFLSVVDPQRFKTHYNIAAAPQAEQEINFHRLRRLPVDYTLPQSINQAISQSSLPSSSNLPAWHDQCLRLTGIILHSLLQRASQIPTAAWSKLFSNTEQLTALCHHAGLTDIDFALEKTGQLFKNISNSTTAQWILDLNHQDAASELVLHANAHEHVIDRTFIENGIRWIIDYKTATPEEGEAIADFLVKQSQQHQAQLQRYAKVFAQQTNLPIKLMLYFPLLDQTITLNAATSKTSVNQG